MSVSKMQIHDFFRTSFHEGSCGPPSTTASHIFFELASQVDDSHILQDGPEKLFGTLVIEEANQVEMSKSTDKEAGTMNT